MPLLQRDSWPQMYGPLRYAMEETIDLVEEVPFYEERMRPTEQWITDLVREDVTDEIRLSSRQKQLRNVKRFIEKHYPHVAKRLEYLRNIEIPDGQKAEIRAAFDRAYSILYEIAFLARRRGIALPRPYTFGTPDNGVQYEWRRGEREFHLEIIPKRGGLRYEYLISKSPDPRDGDEGELTDPIGSSPIVREFLSWVGKG